MKILNYCKESLNQADFSDCEKALFWRVQGPFSVRPIQALEPGCTDWHKQQVRITRSVHTKSALIWDPSFKLLK